MTASVRSILEADLERIGMTQEQFGERLQMTQQGISQWYARDRVPFSRRRQIIDILGKDSQFAREFPPMEEIRSAEPEIKRAYQPRYKSHQSSINPILDRRQEYLAMVDYVRSQVPSVDFDVMVTMGPFHWHIDYVSQKFAAEIIVLTTSTSPTTGLPVMALNPRSLTAKIMDLATIKKASNFSDRTFLAILVAQTTSGSVGKTIERAVWQAELFGVTAVVLGSMAEVARFLIDAELQDEEDVDLGHELGNGAGHEEPM